MTIRSTSFHSIKNLTTCLVVFSIIAIILSIISIAASSFYLTRDLQSNNVYGFIDTFPLIILIPIIIMILIWYYKATKNIRSFGAKEITSPEMAVVWWFIPIMHLWKPYMVSQQIWKASNPDINLTEGTEWKKVPSSKIIKIWWVLVLVAVFGSISAYFVADFLTFINDPTLSEKTTPQKVLLENNLTIPFLVIGIISTICFIRTIRHISNRQQLKSI